MKATKWQEMELAMMVGMYRERPPEAHKGNMGHALLVAGQTGIAGCALLAAESCMRSGVGKLTVFTPEENRLILQLGLPEAIVDTRFATPTDSFQAIGAGPGMGTDHTAMERLQNLLQTHRPMVLDADALSLIAKVGFFTASGHIFTPHAREMERLASGMKLEGSSLTEKAVHLATSCHSHVILKGHPSLVCCPDGTIYSFPRGNAGMATAGSGDVLTGILTGLWAQGYTAHETALLGTWLHATAGDFAAQHLGQESMLASDITRHLPMAFAEIRKLKQNTE
jgi:NAD(P)H-hydrate epimerase